MPRVKRIALCKRRDFASAVAKGRRLASRFGPVCFARCDAEAVSVAKKMTVTVFWWWWWSSRIRLQVLFSVVSTPNVARRCASLIIFRDLHGLQTSRLKRSMLKSSQNIVEIFVGRISQILVNVGNGWEMFAFFNMKISNLDTFRTECIV